MRVVMGAVLVLLAACDGGTGAPVGGTYSCAEGLPDGDGGVTMLTGCLELSGGTAKDLANNQSNCAASNWTFLFAPCPRAGALGGCRESVPGVAITNWFYDDGTMTVSDVQMTCRDEANAGLPVQFVSP